VRRWDLVSFWQRRVSTSLCNYRSCGSVGCLFTNYQALLFFGENATPRYKMKRLTMFICGAFFLFGASLVFANQTHTCIHRSTDRFISVVYENLESKLPCEVQYTRRNQTQTVFWADKELGFCEKKAMELVQKHKKWGWKCGYVVVAASNLEI